MTYGVGPPPLWKSPGAQTHPKPDLAIARQVAMECQPAPLEGGEAPGHAGYEQPMELPQLKHL
jgi:hypothetical protein